MSGGAGAALGRRGEALVRRALERRGVTVLDQNWRCAYGELDLVAATQTALRFVEVKSRRDCRFMEPREAVSAAKRRRLARAAACWLQAHPEEVRPAVFDVAEVHFRGEGYVIRYFACAFEVEE